MTNVTNGRVFTSQGSMSPPDAIDWRTLGAVTSVKNEGECHASWAFSVTGAIEGQYFIKNKKLVSLSEQNLIDCVGGPNNCAQGWPDTAYNYVMYNNGIDTEESYPYEQGLRACRYTAEYRGATIKTFVNIQTANEVQLKEALAVVGPVSVLIDASQPSLPFYSEGVYYDTKCMSQNYNYGALAVGYGVEDGVDYWLLKFSKSESWGDRGYIKIARNRNNHCGVATHATYPEV
ncbi:procathepsin L [Anabrus simplex]|uniref:procathepsin L n=1 Tax=Anabrus simplex TaxID=316456 RepID=UPI0035A2F7C7